MKLENFASNLDKINYVHQVTRSLAESLMNVTWDGDSFEVEDVKQLVVDAYAACDCLRDIRDGLAKVAGLEWNRETEKYQVKTKEASK